MSHACLHKKGLKNWLSECEEDLEETEKMRRDLKKKPAYKTRSKMNEEKKEQDQNETKPKDSKSLVNKKNESKAFTSKIGAIDATQSPNLNIVLGGSIAKKMVRGKG